MLLPFVLILINNLKIRLYTAIIDDIMYEIGMKSLFMWK